MNETSKCGQCLNREQCQIRSNLSRMIQKVIINAEKEVKQLAPKEIDYLVFTDISITPTQCTNYKCRESSEEWGRLFMFRREMPM